MKHFIFFAAALLLTQSAYADGITTSSSQSIQYKRMLSRSASTDIDAVYYNPGALTKLADGFHLGIFGDALFRENTVSSGFPLLNTRDFVGKVGVSVVPMGFLVYKNRNIALSLGFGQNAGYGSTNFEKGLPAFQIPVAATVDNLSVFSVTGYKANLNFTRESTFWGLQMGATYKANDNVSLYGGVRILPAANRYEGSIKDVKLIAGGVEQAAPLWLTQLSSQFTTAANSYTGSASGMQSLIALGAGNYTIAQVQNAGYISAAQRASYEGTLASLGYSPAQIAAMNITQIKSYFSNAATASSNKSTLAASGAKSLSDKSLAVRQSGTGYTPIIGLNITPAKNLNIGIKYEFKTSVELTNETTTDDLELYPDAQKVQNSLPAILSIGVGYETPKMEAQFSCTMYFDKGTDWGKNEHYRVIYPRGSVAVPDRDIETNGYELGLGIQLNLSEFLSLSLGGMRSKMNVGSQFNSDFYYVNPSFSLGGGVKYNIDKRITLEAGLSNTFFEKVDASYRDFAVGTYVETYDQSAISFGIGISYNIGIDAIF